MPIFPDPADRADEFSRRYAEDLDLAEGQVILDLASIQSGPGKVIGVRESNQGK